MKTVIAIVMAVALTACGGGGGGGPAVVDCTPIAGVPGTKVWIGSANGSIVVDADDKHAMFAHPSGFMVYKDFIYPAILVEDGGAIFVDVEPNGNYIYSESKVYYIKATNGCTIMGGVTDTGFFLRIIELGVGMIDIEVSTKAAVFAPLPPEAGGKDAAVGVNIERKADAEVEAESYSLGTFIGYPTDGVIK